MSAFISWSSSQILEGFVDTAGGRYFAEFLVFYCSATEAMHLHIFIIIVSLLKGGFIIYFFFCKYILLY